MSCQNEYKILSAVINNERFDFSGLRRSVVVKVKENKLKVSIDVFSKMICKAKIIVFYCDYIIHHLSGRQYQKSGITDNA